LFTSNAFIHTLLLGVVNWQQIWRAQPVFDL